MMIYSYLIKIYNIKRTINCLALIIFINLTSCREPHNLFENNRGNESLVLFHLMNKRLELAFLVAKIKWNTKEPINDPTREKYILDIVKIRGQKLGLDESFVNDFFKAQFEAGKIIQKRLHKQWNTAKQPYFEKTPNLNEIRPLLDSLNSNILIELRKLEPNSYNKQKIIEMYKKAYKIMNSDFDNQIIITALQPIEAYCKIK